LTDSLRLDRLARRSLAERAIVWLQRLVAVLCLAAGILYWARIVGAPGLPGEGAPWRFDLMPLHWQVASVTLAMFFPFAALGLWMLTSWGPVIWLICAGTETAMFAGRPDLFGANRLTLLSHGATVVLYAALSIAVFAQKRRAEVSPH
jgi:hypothetical protein